MCIWTSIKQFAWDVVSSQDLRLFSQPAEGEEVIELSDSRSAGLSHVAGAWEATSDSSEQRASVIQACDSRSVRDSFRLFSELEGGVGRMKRVE